MKHYRHTGNIKTALFIIGIALVIGLLTYTKILINELRSDNRAIVRVYAEIIANAVKDENDKNLDFIFDNIIKKVQFPIIQTNLDHIPQMWKNLPESVNDSISRQKFLVAMDVINNPIPLLYKVEGPNEIIFGYLHYGDSVLITKLQWWTYIELFSIGLFIFLGFIGFSFIRNNEKRYIWVGMARETAHQLGTPVSALMGWVDLIQESPDKVEEMVPEIKLDLKRLEQINRRFSNMGTTLELVNIDLSKNLERVINYLNRRMPSLGKKVTLINDIEPGIFFPANSSLLAWSIENIVINSIDSIDNEKGVVEISLKETDNRIIIRIRDNGRGIPRKDWRNIFRPGFSTKATGWGLGLSLSSRIIQDIHKGKIKVVESTKDKGTLIEILL